MWHRRCALMLVALLAVGSLSAGCTAGEAPPPAATPTRAALQPASGAATAAVPAVSPAIATSTSPSSTTAPLPPSPTPSATPASPTPTATPTATPSPPPTDTDTPTPTALPSDTPLPPTSTPPPAREPTATSLPPTSTPTTLPPTATPGHYRFLPAGPALPDPSHPCPGCPRAPAYIVGRVTDAAGNPLAGVRLSCYNDWYHYPVVASKDGGEYDVALTQGETTWFVVVVDGDGRPISPVVAVAFRPAESCRYMLDWRRVD